MNGVSISTDRLGSLVYDITQFGGDKSGVNGISAAWNNLINSLPTVSVSAEQQSMNTTPAVVWFPPGTYLVDQSLSQPFGKAAIHIVGAGQYGTIFKAANGLNAPMFNIGLVNGQSGLLNGIRLAHLGINGNSANNTTACHGIKLSSVHHGLIEDVNVQDVAGRHIWLSGVTGPSGFCLGCTLRDVFIDGYTSGGDGLYMDSTADCRFERVISVDCLRNFYLNGSTNAAGVFSNSFHACESGGGNGTSPGFYMLDTQRILLDTLIFDGTFATNARLVQVDSTGQDVDDIKIVNSIWRPGGNVAGNIAAEFNAGVGRNIRNVRVASGLFDATQDNNPLSWAFHGSGTFTNCRVDGVVHEGTMQAPILPASGVSIDRCPGYNPLAVASITVTASPFTYTNADGCDEIVNVFGGTVTAISLRGTTLTGQTSGQFLLHAGDALIVTYTGAPTMWKVPL